MVEGVEETALMEEGEVRVYGREVYVGAVGRRKEHQEGIRKTSVLCASS